MLWIEEDRELPPSYLQSVSVSHPLIFIAQVARLLAAQEDGLQAIFEAKSLGVVAGYSQGLLPALFVSEHPDGNFSIKRKFFKRYFFIVFN